MRWGRPMIRAALYARVSTMDQDPELQLVELRQLAAQRGWTATEYIDHGVSGVRASRPALNRLLADAQAGRLDLVAVWRLDRLGRSVLDLVNILSQLDTAHVGFTSQHDPGIDTTTPVGRLLFQIVGAFAEFERNLIRERTRAGLARARARGVQLGRPGRLLNRAAVEAAVTAQGSIRGAARTLGLAESTLREFLQRGVQTAARKTSP